NSVGANQTSYIVTGLIPNTAYRFRVRAQQSSVYSAYSNTVAATPTGLGAPDDLSAAASSSTQVALSWRDNSGAETGFEVQKRVVGGSFPTVATTGAGATSYTVNDLDENETYEFRVRATDGTTNSAFSSIAAVGDCPCPAPTNMVATVVSDTRIDLTWTD